MTSDPTSVKRNVDGARIRTPGRLLGGALSGGVASARGGPMRAAATRKDQKQRRTQAAILATEIRRTAQPAD